MAESKEEGNHASDLSDEEKMVVAIDSATTVIRSYAIYNAMRKAYRMKGPKQIAASLREIWVLMMASNPKVNNFLDDDSRAEQAIDAISKICETDSIRKLMAKFVQEVSIMTTR